MNTTLADKLAAYKPDESAIKLIRETPILLLVGPTGAGKDSVKEKLQETGSFHHIVSHTTRRPRINHGVIEQNGREYHFINIAFAERMLDEHAVIEAKMVHGNVYATSVAEIAAAQKENKIAMTDVDAQGVSEYKEMDPNVMAVFLLPPNFQIWQERLKRRYGEVVDTADYRMRLQTALHELDELLTTNYYVALINEDLDEVVDQILAVTASKNHTTSDQPAVRKVAEQLAADIRSYLDKTS